MNRGDKIISKQAYNDDLNRRLRTHLELEKVSRMTVREYCRRAHRHLDGIETVCTHPGEDARYRRIGLIEGLNKLDAER